MLAAYLAIPFNIISSYIQRSSVWTHLKLLGMANVPEEADLGFSEDLDGGGRRCRASNFGLLRSAGLTLLEELLLSRRLKVASSTSGESWCSRFTNTLATLQQALCPVESNGETMAPILQHLLVEARVSSSKNWHAVHQQLNLRYFYERQVV